MGIDDREIDSIKIDSFINAILDFTALVEISQLKKPITPREVYLCKRKLIRAVVCYRVAHKIFYLKRIESEIRVDKAEQISKNAALETGIEIHPSTYIGERFIINYGPYSEESIDTKICENMNIGDDFY
jgi:serine acetyltransferase